MKHKSVLKHLLSVCLCTAFMLICLVGIAVNADAATIIDSGTCGDDLIWTLDNEGTVTISGTGATSDYGMYSGLFEHSDKVVSVIFEYGVTDIDGYMFQYCDNLTSVTIPDSVTSIGEFAFYKCENLQYNIYDNGKYLGNAENPYFAIVDSTSTNIASCNIHPDTNIIGGSAFRYCNELTAVTIPYGTTKIDDNAFYGCDNLASITIPNSVTSIGDGAFRSCDALQYTAYDNAEYLGNENNPYLVLVNASSDIESCEIHPQTKVIGSCVFQFCNNLSSIIIPDGVVHINMGAFASCENLVSVTIGDSVLAIGEGAFYNCGSLATLSIPDSITNIGIDAFEYCNNLQYNMYDNAYYIGNEINPYVVLFRSPYGEPCNINSDTRIIYDGAFDSNYTQGYVTIPAGVVSIGNSSFSSCNLTSIFVDQNNPYYSSDSSGVLFNKDKTVLIQVPSGISGAYSIPDSVTSISSYTFDECNNLTSVSIPDSVSVVVHNTFYNCSSLTSVYIPDSVGYIDCSLNGAFYMCSNLTDIIVDQNNPYYSNNGDGILFDKNKTSLIYVPCGKSGSYTIPDSVSSIEDYAFNNCARVSFVTIPDGVTSIGNYTFWGCDSLERIIFKGNAPTIKDNSFYGVTATAYYPADNDTWTEDAMQDYGGTITWVAYSPLKINKQPATQKVVDGKTAKFTVSATGDNITYQWQYRTSSSGSWKNASATGNKTATLSVPATISRTGYQYRCVITDAEGNKLYSKTVYLYVLGIKTQPVTQKVKDGKTAKFTVSATGASKKYQWQYRTSSSGSWKTAKATGNTTATLSVPASVSRSGYQYRCKITDSAGNVIYTDAVSLYVLGIKAQPATKTVVDGKTAKFTVSATGASKKYQWQYRTSSSGSWKNASATGNKTKTLSVPASVSRHGYQYRCKITDSAGNKVYTETVSLYVLGIKTQPANKTVKVGATAKFTVAATGKGLTYQWQYKTSSGSWKNTSATGSKTKTLSVPGTKSRNGYQYRCKITDSAGNIIYTKTVKLTVK